jgi:hypothetical protein
MDDKRALLRHFLAALAYRVQKALRHAPNSFVSFDAGNQIRTPLELVRHMTSVLGYARTQMTHAGQFAMLRRLAGSPVPPDNFIVANVDASNFGQEQAPPVSPDAVWLEAPPVMDAR